MTTADFSLAFRYRNGSIIAPWKDVSRDDEPQGDCQDFAWSVLILETGSKAKALLALLTLRAMIWRCHSPANGILPRHAVLRYRGQFIDSTVREWRASPSPHKKRWPVGLPVLVGLLGLFGLAGPIYADPQCIALPQFIDGLASRYAETPRTSGLAGNQLLVITASDAGTWTALMVNPDGTACMVSAGEAFVIAPVAVPGVLN